MNQNKCQNCQYYLQHYTLTSRALIRVFCGHCTFFGAKSKRPHTKACEHFVPGPANSDAFVSKEYLSKELLEYMRNLELLPEIKDDCLQK